MKSVTSRLDRQQLQLVNCCRVGDNMIQRYGGEVREHFCPKWRIGQLDSW